MRLFSWEKKKKKNLILMVEESLKNVIYIYLVITVCLSGRTPKRVLRI